MKKQLLLATAVLLCGSVLAQNARKVSREEVQNRIPFSNSQKQSKIVKPRTVEMMPYRQSAQPASSANRVMAGVALGTTIYDNQSNYGGTDRRVKNWNDGTLSATWTMTQDPAGGSSADRGTGYVYFDGTNWSAAPSASIQAPTKTGWTNIDGNSTIGEVNIAHNSNLWKDQRATKGSGAWTSGVQATGSYTWPRLATGGANNNSIHVIVHNGINGDGSSTNLLYFRSQDGGATWDITDGRISALDSTQMIDPTADGYAIACKGDVVAVVAGGFGNDLVLAKSTDNGSTWTKTIINQFPVAGPGGAGTPFNSATQLTDIDGDGIADTCNTMDSSPSIVIDANNQVHVVCGSTRVLETDVTAGLTYFPATDGLYYWNESYGPNTISNYLIAEAEDINGNGVIDLQANDPAIYQCGITSMASISYDGATGITVVYSSIIEGTTNAAGDQSYRNVYCMSSQDGGATWSTPVRFDSDDFSEQAFVSTAYDMTISGSNHISHIIYHVDEEPGTQIGPDGDGPTVSTITYNTCGFTVGLNEADKFDFKVSVQPNPASTITNLKFTTVTSQNVSIQITNIFGQLVKSMNVDMISGENTLPLDLKQFCSGVYNVNFIAKNQTASTKFIVK